ncbi:MAG: hypothetical protein AB1801_25770, partial [Chloroflexota bacterium]
MKQAMWITILIVFSLGLTGCGAALGLEEESSVPKEPIDAAAWPTPAPTVSKGTPTPFPRVDLPPTATPAPRPASAGNQAEPLASLTPVATTNAGATLSDLADQLGLLGGLSPVAVGFVTQDNTTVRQAPNGSANAAGTVDSAELVGILGQNSDGNWLYVITITRQQGWLPPGALRITGSLADAPVVPDNPLAAALAQLGAQNQPTESGAAAPVATEIETSRGESAAAIPAAVKSSAPAVASNTLAPLANATVNRKIELRRGPGENFGAVDELTVDEQVTVRAIDQGQNWVVVEASRARFGWAPLDSLTVAGSLDNAAPVVTGWVESNALEVKSGPGIYYDTVGQLAMNTVVSILGLNEGRNWALVETAGGGQGWLPLRFLSNTGSLADAPELSPEMLAAGSAADQPALPKPPAVAAGQLVFQLSSGGQIMAINADGSGLRPLTHGIDPALSPDGQTVAFTRWQGETGSVWLIGLDGSNERQILDFTKQAKGPAWSPDGSQLVINFQQGGRLDEDRVCEDAAKGIRPPRNASDVEGGLHQNSDGEFEPVVCWTVPPDPFWNLRVIKLADGAYEDVDGGTYAFRPAWDPTQPWRIVSDGGKGLVEVDLNRKVEQAITDNVNDGSPVFSPDGRFIAVTAGRQGSGEGHDIYRLNADGTGRVRLTQTPLWVPVQAEEQKPWNNVAPVWSPDGSQIAFLTDRTGRWEIWLMHADGANQRPMFSAEINDQLNFAYDFVDEHVL